MYTAVAFSALKVWFGLCCVCCVQCVVCCTRCAVCVVYFRIVSNTACTPLHPQVRPAYGTNVTTDQPTCSHILTVTIESKCPHVSEDAVNRALAISSSHLLLGRLSVTSSDWAITPLNRSAFSITSSGSGSGSGSALGGGESEAKSEAKSAAGGGLGAGTGALVAALQCHLKAGETLTRHYGLSPITHDGVHGQGASGGIAGGAVGGEGKGSTQRATSDHGRRYGLTDTAVALGSESGSVQGDAAEGGNTGGVPSALVRKFLGLESASAGARAGRTARRNTRRQQNEANATAGANIAPTIESVKLKARAEARREAEEKRIAKEVRLYLTFEGDDTSWCVVECVCTSL